MFKLLKPSLIYLKSFKSAPNLQQAATLPRSLSRLLSGYAKASEHLARTSGNSSLSSDSRQQYLSQQYPPSLLKIPHTGARPPPSRVSDRLADWDPGVPAPLPVVPPISLLTLSLLTSLDSNFPVNPLWAWEFHPLSSRLCLSQTL